MILIIWRKDGSDLVLIGTKIWQTTTIEAEDYVLRNRRQWSYILKYSIIVITENNIIKKTQGHIDANKTGQIKWRHLQSLKQQLPTCLLVSYIEYANILR